MGILNQFGDLLFFDHTIIFLAKIDRKVKHPKLGKIIRRSSKISFHDEANVCSLGDKVTIKECRPISKTKSWTLVEILKEAKS